MPKRTLNPLLFFLSTNRETAEEDHEAGLEQARAADDPAVTDEAEKAENVLNGRQVDSQQYPQLRLLNK